MRVKFVCAPKNGVFPPLEAYFDTEADFDMSDKQWNLTSLDDKLDLVEAWAMEQMDLYFVSMELSS